MTRSFITVTTTNAFCEENEREREERRKSERKKERKERLFCDIVKRFSVALLLFSVKVFGVGGKGHVTNIVIKTHALTLFSTARNTREKEEKAVSERTSQRQH